jgi:hypothetical protein
MLKNKDRTTEYNKAMKEEDKEYTKKKKVEINKSNKPIKNLYLLKNKQWLVKKSDEKENKFY